MKYLLLLIIIIGVGCGSRDCDINALIKERDGLRHHNAYLQYVLTLKDKEHDSLATIKKIGRPAYVYFADAAMLSAVDTLDLEHPWMIVKFEDGNYASVNTAYFMNHNCYDSVRKHWNTYLHSDTLNFRLINDANTEATTIFKITRNNKK